MNKKSLFIGIGVTIIWFLGITIFCIWANFGFANKDLNTLGDFLAGIFAPIAFFWLILGYVQQGKQLDQNTKALEQQERALQLQIDEMRESVKQQTELADIQRQQLSSIVKQKKPILNVRCIVAEINCTYMDNNKRRENPSIAFQLEVGSVNNDMRNFQIQFENGEMLESCEIILKSSNKKFYIDLFSDFFTFSDSFGVVLDGSLIFTFEDDFGNQYTEKYSLWVEMNDFSLEKGDIMGFGVKKIDYIRGNKVHRSEL
jgi:hypothetical protein